VESCGLAGTCWELDGINGEGVCREKIDVQRCGGAWRGLGGWATDVGGRRRMQPWEKLADKRQVDAGIGLRRRLLGKPATGADPSALLRYKVYEPILVIGPEKLANIDIRLRVKGGGHVSQLYALRQAIAKGVVA